MKSNMKPILFNTDMVQGLLNSTKTVTRRVVKPQPVNISYHGAFRGDKGPVPVAEYQDNSAAQLRFPYSPGDILYVRETWQEVYETEFDSDAPGSCVNIRTLIPNFDFISKVEAGVSTNCSCAAMKPRMKYYVFKASDIEYVDPQNKLVWRPSIHMPREAARIFLRVTNVRVERLQDVDGRGVLAEGVDNGHSNPQMGQRWENMQRMIFSKVWNNCYAKPRPVKGADSTIDHYESYPWEDIQETRTYRGKPWYVIGNPWVWVIEFERIGKEEGFCEH